MTRLQIDWRNGRFYFQYFDGDTVTAKVVEKVEMSEAARKELAPKMPDELAALFSRV